METAVAPDRRLLIKRPRTEFQLDEIIRIEGALNYSFIHLANGNKILVSKTIWTLAAQLPEFIRIHKGHLVNPAFVETLQTRGQTSGHLKMTTGDVLPVAKRRKHDVRLLLRQFRNATRTSKS